jgi:hypothetical protein
MPTAVAEQVSTKFKLPDVEIGDIVWTFKEFGDDKREAAVVTGIGERVLAVHILQESNAYLRPVDAARYLNDPDLKDPERRQTALWDGCIFELTPASKRLNQLKNDVETLKAEVAALKSKKSKAE